MSRFPAASRSEPSSRSRQLQYFNNGQRVGRKVGAQKPLERPGSFRLYLIGDSLDPDHELIDAVHGHPVLHTLVLAGNLYVTERCIHFDVSVTIRDGGVAASVETACFERNSSAREGSRVACADDLHSEAPGQQHLSTVGRVLL